MAGTPASNPAGEDAPEPHAQAPTTQPPPPTTTHLQPAPRRWLPYAALALLALIWGASFLFIKIAVQDMSPEVLTLIRSASGAATMALFLTLTGRLPDRQRVRRNLPAFAVMAILSGVLPWTAISWGELYISSGLASILNSTTPLWTALFAFWVTPAERPTPLNYAGVVVGFAGTLLLIGPDLARHGLNAPAVGTFVVLIGAASYSAAALYQRRKLPGVNPYDATLWQVLLTALFVFPLTLPTLAHTHIRPLSLGSALILGTAGTAIAYVLYYYLLNTLGATRATMVTYLLPITAVIWGIALLRETVTIPIVVGMVVIMIGVYLAGIQRRRSRDT